MNHEEGPQAAAVRRQLRQLVEAHGPDLLDDARRVRAMLGDAVVGATAEANLIGLAISSGVPTKLRRGTAVSAIVAELQQTSSVQPQDAQWAVGAIASALGMEPSAAPAAAAEPAARPVPSATPAEAHGSDDLVISGAGMSVVVRSGSVGTIGRDPGSTVALGSAAVSRHHAQVQRGDSGWEYTDVGSTQGSFRDGAAVRTTTLSGPTDITLGQGAEAVRLHFAPGSPAARPAPERARPDVAVAAPATEVPGRPGGALGGAAPKTEVTGGEVLTVTLGGMSRVVAAGGALTVGREVDNDLVSPGTTASRHHLRIEQVGGTWMLRDLGSSSGTWLAGQRVTESALRGRQEFVLGDPGRGDRLTTQAPGDTASAPRTTGASALRGKGPAWLVPAAAAAAIVLVIGVIAVAWRSHSGSGGSSQLTTTQLAQATVRLVRPDGGWGSGVVVDSKRGLIMTNAHVAQPQALGQGLPPYSGTAPTMQTELEATANPEQLAVYVSKTGASSAVPMFWAQPVAWDGYLDVAIVKINRIYDGPDDPSSATVAGPGDWDFLPQVPLGDSSKLSSGEDIGIWGYPADPGSKAPNFGHGQLSSPVEDTRLAAKWGPLANEAIWNFQGAQILHGNSGGLAFDEKTHTMIGIPTWYVPDQDAGAPVASRMRPVNFVKPVLAAAQAGRKYTSPYVTAAPRSARMTYLTDGAGATPGVGACNDFQEGGYTTVAFNYSGFPGGKHTDLAANLWVQSGGQYKLVDYVVAPLPNHMDRKGCVTFTFNQSLPKGDYEIEVGVGGDLHVVFDSVETLG